MTPEETDRRMNRGLSLSEKSTIIENANGSFCVPSQSVEEIAYLVRLIDGKYLCNCPDFVNRKPEICKHGFAVKFWIANHVELQAKPKPKVFADDSIQCDNCGSIRVIKYGISCGKQVFKCQDCKHKFREQSLLRKAHYSPETVTLTLDLYFSGLSLRKIARTVSDNFGEDLSYSTIYSWICKYIPRISDYVNSLSPRLSDSWHADELFVKMKRGVDHKTNSRKFENIAFLWNVMDRKTRFLLASKLSRFRDDNGAFQAFKEARANSHKQYPEKIFVDGAHAYYNIGTGMNVKGWNPQVIAKVGIRKPHANNNRIERLNGTLRERAKVQRGWKSMETPLAEGQRIHYNFVKPHSALEGMTPSQRAGIQTRGWSNLIRSAVESKENK